MPIDTISETKWFPIFRAGTHTGSNPTTGDPVTREWTEDDIDRIVELNAPRMDRVPAVLGHPQTDDPALGWGGAIRKEVRDGVAYVYAKLRDAVRPFADAVNAGMYKNVSIRIQPDLTLRHIGFLGAARPGVEGMPAAQFEGGDDEGERYDIQFGDAERVYQTQALFRRVVGWFGRLRDHLVATAGMDDAEKILPRDDVTWANEVIEGMDENIESEISSYTHPNQGGDDMGQEQQLREQVQQLTDENSRLKAENQQFSEKIGTLEQDIDGLKRQAEQSAADVRRAEHTQFVDGLIAEGKLPPAEREMTISFMEVASQSDQEVEFTIGDEKKKASELDAYKEMLQARPKVLDTTEFARTDKAAGAAGGAQGTAGEKLERITQEKLKENKDLSYSVAFSQAQAEHPELAQEYVTELR